jgi:hypothetical protein
MKIQTPFQKQLKELTFRIIKHKESENVKNGLYTFSKKPIHMVETQK